MDSATPGDDGGSDAEGPDNGPWPAAHAAMPVFTNLGGAVLSAPKIVTVTFLGNANRDAIRTFDDQLISGPWWTAVTQGYGVGAATGGIYVELPDTVSNTTIDDSQFPGLITGWIQSGAMPPPDANTLYVMYFPASTTITLQPYGASCVGYGAYHSDGPISVAGGAMGPDGGALDTAYAVIPDCGQGMPGLTTSASHEIIEASTDPHPNTVPAWYGYNDAWFKMGGSAGGQGEVADVCERNGYVTDGFGNLLSRSWVDTAALASHDPCQPETPGEVFFSCAVPTQVAGSTTAGGTTSSGYILMKQGETKTIDSVIFSDAQLPEDVQLTVGLRGHSGTLGSIGGGITMTLSPTSGHNGMHVALTIAVPSTALAEDYPNASNGTAIVRATLNTAATSADAAPTSVHHDWPFIVRVQQGP
jgi:hypothetical protein